MVTHTHIHEHESAVESRLTTKRHTGEGRARHTYSNNTKRRIRRKFSRTENTWLQPLRSSALRSTLLVCSPPAWHGNACGPTQSGEASVVRAHEPVPTANHCAQLDGHDTQLCCYHFHISKPPASASQSYAPARGCLSALTEHLPSAATQTACGTPAPRASRVRASRLLLRNLLDLLNREARRLPRAAHRGLEPELLDPVRVLLHVRIAPDGA